MGEIKFRAFYNNRFYYFTLNQGSYCFEQDGIYNMICLNRIKLEQFTGLRDKNGKEIYEWDIVRTFYKFGDDVPEIRIAIVERDTVNPCFVLHWIGANLDWYEYDFVKCGMMIIEVIGNIHENPELLELAN